MFFNNYNKPGRGISKEELESKSGIELYFDILFRRIWKMMTLNLLYVLVSIPAILISLAVSVYFLTLTASIRGVDISGSSTSILILGILFSIAFFQITGSGPASVAKNYVLRKYVNDRHSWFFSDFFENIKKNFKQGIAVYIINTVVITALLFAWVFYSFILRNSILPIIVIIIMAIFAMMQLYVYQLVACVELKVKYIYKNALALTVIKLPWNVIVMVVTAVFVSLIYYLAINISPVFIVFAFAIYFSLLIFTQIFMTNNVVNKYIIDPGMNLGNE